MPVVVRAGTPDVRAGSRLRTDFRSGNYERGESYTVKWNPSRIVVKSRKRHRAGGNFGGGTFERFGIWMQIFNR